MKEIAKFAEHLECPLVDGIVFSDGTIQPLNVDGNWANPVKFNIALLPLTSINQLKNEENLDWITCGILNEHIDEANAFKISCGEASFGGDGFVSVINTNTNETIWIAFFTNSNPFTKVNIIGHTIFATSTLGCIWQFDLYNPVNLKVQCL